LILSCTHTPFALIPRHPELSAAKTKDPETTHIIPTPQTFLPTLPTAGTLIYIMVDSVAATCDTIVALGGEIVQPIAADAPEITARFRDLAGNILGLYQHRG
jgi:predicted enzyme related to lactoylglutathione lyase